MMYGSTVILLNYAVYLLLQNTLILNYAVYLLLETDRQLHCLFPDF